MSIRLIVSDLDGTLLDSNGELPVQFATTLDKLIERGITFAACSGRNWETLRLLFLPYHTKMDFICDNGAFIYRRGMEPLIHTMSKALWQDIVKLCYARDDCHAILCGVKRTYTTNYSHNKALANQIADFYNGIVICNDLESDIDDEIFKITICCPGNDSTRIHKFFNAAFGDMANIQPTHPAFVDVMKQGISKGSGVRTLQHSLGIGPEQTMAFGDYFNDIEMLQNSGHPFVVSNAPCEMHKYGELAPANDQIGVIQTIEKYVLQTNC